MPFMKAQLFKLFERYNLWRRGRYLALLSGSGIEIGALHRPVKAPHLSVSYVDRHSLEEIENQYPELAELDIVPPDYVADAHTLDGIESNSQDFVIYFVLMSARAFQSFVVSSKGKNITWTRMG